MLSHYLDHFPTVTYSLLMISEGSITNRESLAVCIINSAVFIQFPVVSNIINAYSTTPLCQHPTVVEVISYKKYDKMQYK